MAGQPPEPAYLFDTQGRLRSLLRALLFVLFYVLFLFAASWVTAFLAMPLPLAPVMREILVMVVGGAAAVLLASILVLGGVEERTFSFIGLGWEPGWALQLGVGFLIGLGMVAGIILLEWSTGHLRIVAAGMSVPASVARLFLVLFLFLVGALHEELLFRGYGFQRMLEVLGAPAGVLLLAAVFGAIHWGNPNASPAGLLNAVLAGVLLAVAYLRTRRLWLPIGLHWSWNFFEAAFGLPVSGIRIEAMPLAAEVGGRELFHGGSYGPEGSLFASAVIVAAVVLMLRVKPAAPAAASREVV